MSDSGVDESDDHVSNNNSDDSDPVPRQGRRSSGSEAAADGTNQTDEGEDESEDEDEDDGGGRTVHTNTKPPTVHCSRPVRTTAVVATMKKVLVATSIVLVGLRGEEQVRKRGVGNAAEQGRKGGFKERVPLASLP